MNASTGTGAAQASAIDAGLVNALVNSTKEVFATMTNSQVEVKGIKPLTDYTPQGDISAIIGIVGAKGDGMVALSFPTSLANLVVSRLLGMTPDSVSAEDRCDGIGELVNMVSGNAKTILSRESGGSYQLSIPTIILGSAHEVYTRPSSAPYLLITFGVEDQQFELQVTFKFH